ncbi:uncharacterized protein METZ01_LOCUS278207 [marine metagenome]|uniref:Uncharacterized protein n=1 Tax=marine metagenome TaxID=408172 RepID=A0A382KPH1_9ZZZZ
MPALIGVYVVPSISATISNYKYE